LHEAAVLHVVHVVGGVGGLVLRQQRSAKKQAREEKICRSHGLTLVRITKTALRNDSAILRGAALGQELSCGDGGCGLRVGKRYNAEP
jgi:hypothetical protein